MVYLYTLDSHDCYGPFSGVFAAHTFAVIRGLNSYQLLATVPYPLTTVVITP